MHVLASWQHSALYALAVTFVFTATTHFNKMKHDLAQMIPSSFPRPLLIVYITGVLELLGAAGWSRNFAGLRAFVSLRSSSGCSHPCECYESRRSENVMLIDGDEAFRVVPLGIACKSSATCHVPDHAAVPEA